MEYALTRWNHGFWLHTVLCPPALRSDMVPHRRETVSTARMKYQQGVAKMTDMQDKLSALRTQIAAMAPELERSREEVEALMGLIGREKAEAQVGAGWFAMALIGRESRGRGLWRRRWVRAGCSHGVK